MKFFEEHWNAKVVENKTREIADQAAAKEDGQVDPKATLGNVSAVPRLQKEEAAKPKEELMTQLLDTWREKQKKESQEKHNQSVQDVFSRTRKP